MYDTNKSTLSAFVSILHVSIESSFKRYIHLQPVPLQVPVPRFAVGIVIGRNGEMIKKIQNDAGVRIQFKAGLFTSVNPDKAGLPL